MCNSIIHPQTLSGVVWCLVSVVVVTNPPLIWNKSLTLDISFLKWTYVSKNCSKLGGCTVGGVTAVLPEVAAAAICLVKMF